MSGTKDRKDRILNPKSGAWGSSSQDFVHLAIVLLKQSEEYAKKHDGNVSMYSLAGIPVLFSALRALLIEVSSGMYGVKGTTEQIYDLVDMPDINYIKKYYDIDDKLLADFKIAYEIRNEIAHPSHMPAGTEDGTPSYLSTLSELNLLQNGIWVSQLKSHKLYIWVFEIFELIVDRILLKHYLNDKDRLAHFESWSRYKTMKIEN